MVQRRASNYYAVNINGAIDANILEDYLIQGFQEKAIYADFEYAVYDCQSQELVYGNYCKLSDRANTKKQSEILPKFDDLIYYFVVKFPNRTGYILSSMWQHILLTVATLLTLTFFIYSIWVILQQKKLSELQKDFINNMTHEFKTPISSIKIASNYIKNHPTIKVDSRLLKYSDIISEQNDRLNHQVEKVLSLAKFEEDQFRLHKEILDPNEILKNICLSEKLKLNESGVGQIEYELSSKSVVIEADKLHFTNVLHTLLDNAIKYCKESPQITVRSSQKHETVAIEIIDQGIGIQKEEISNLFKKFYRVPKGNVHDVKGFGLGLYYVHNICIAHHWKITVESTLGVGSNFKLEIPVYHE